MQSILTRLVGGAGVVLGVLLAATSYAADDKPAPKDKPAEAKPAAAEAPDVHRLEINNGRFRRVHYYEKGLAPGESNTIRDLERAENEADYADSLQALKQMYVDSDLYNEPYRRAIQKQLNGTTALQTASDSFNWAMSPGNVNRSPVVPPGFPVFAPFTNTGGYGGAGLGGMGGLAGLGSSGGSTTAILRSLLFGVGDEGRLKTAMAPTIAGQSTSEYAARAHRDYNNALARAAASPRLRDALARVPNSGITAAATTVPTAPVVVTLKNGDRIEGKNLEKEGDFYVITSDKRTIRVLKSEVMSIDTESNIKIKDASSK
jgi:hypothetical protein